MDQQFIVGWNELRSEPAPQRRVKRFNLTGDAIEQRPMAFVEGRLGRIGEEIPDVLAYQFRPCLLNECGGRIAVRVAPLSVHHINAAGETIQNGERSFHGRAFLRGDERVPALKVQGLILR